MARPVSSPEAVHLVSQDVLLLQYAYSQKLNTFASRKVQSLMMKFANAFGPYLNNSSLRHATLAYIATRAPVLLQPERVEHHCLLACRAIRGRTVETIDEGDLFAACLLTYIACQKRDSSGFRVHVYGLIAIIKAMIERRTESTYMVFWPLARDLVLAGSRQVPRVNDSIIEFCYFSRQLCSVTDHNIRGSKLRLQLYGLGNDRETDKPYKSMVHFYVLLRRCLWETICLQLQNGDHKLDVQLTGVITGLSEDIRTQEVEKLAMSPRFTPFPCIMYHVCALLLAILQRKDVLTGGASVASKARSLRTLLVQNRAIVPGCYTPVLHMMGGCLPRILAVMALGLGKDITIEGMSQI